MSKTVSKAMQTIIENLKHLEPGELGLLQEAMVNKPAKTEAEKSEAQRFELFKKAGHSDGVARYAAGLKMPQTTGGFLKMPA